MSIHSHNSWIQHRLLAGLSGNQVSLSKLSASSQPSPITSSLALLLLIKLQLNPAAQRLIPQELHVGQNKVRPVQVISRLGTIDRQLTKAEHKVETWTCHSGNFINSRGECTKLRSSGMDLELESVRC